MSSLVWIQNACHAGDIFLKYSFEERTLKNQQATKAYKSINQNCPRQFRGIRPLMYIEDQL